MTSSTRKLAATPMAKGRRPSPSLRMKHALTRGSSFVEFETAADLKKAVESLDGREFKEQRVNCVANVRISPAHLVISVCSFHTDPA